ncbi:MAG: replication initiator protein A [Planctomycetales bacterium]|nr:replication initiator protein A [Planctomycetales bacterium]
MECTGNHDGVEEDLITTSGRDEMNLVEIPFGPITRTKHKTLHVSSTVFDPQLKRHIKRQTLITGSDAFGLPRPIDEKVLVGLITLTHEAGFVSRNVNFSGYKLCKTIGWKPDGRAYQRLEESLKRIAGTMFDFKDAWWDKGEREWESHTFHLIEDVTLCSRNQIDRRRKGACQPDLGLCRFTWSQTVWKSFSDGYIRAIDMNLFRRISSGRRREVPLRLFRILDKHFYRSRSVRFDLANLCIEKLGMNGDYCESEMIRILRRATSCLGKCGYPVRIDVEKGSKVVFMKGLARLRPKTHERADAATRVVNVGHSADNPTNAWAEHYSEEQLRQIELRALETEFGTSFERKMIELDAGRPVRESGAIRKNFLRRFLEETLAA